MEKWLRLSPRVGRQLQGWVCTYPCRLTIYILSRIPDHDIFFHRGTELSRWRDSCDAFTCEIQIKSECLWAQSTFCDMLIPPRSEQSVAFDPQKRETTDWSRPTASLSLRHKVTRAMSARQPEDGWASWTSIHSEPVRSPNILIIPQNPSKTPLF